MLASAVDHATYSPRNPGIADEAYRIILLYEIRMLGDEFVRELESGCQMMGDCNNFRVCAGDGGGGETRREVSGRRAT